MGRIWWEHLANNPQGLALCQNLVGAVLGKIIPQQKDRGISIFSSPQPKEFQGFLRMSTVHVPSGTCHVVHKSHARSISLSGRRGRLDVDNLRRIRMSFFARFGRCVFILCTNKDNGNITTRGYEGRTP